MPESGSMYAKYVVDKDMMPPLPPEYVKNMEDQRKEGRIVDQTLLLGIQDSILKGSFFCGCEWLWGLTGNGPVSLEIEHSHDFDEIIGFAGSNRNYPRELGGEIDFHMGGEVLTLIHTCYVFIPRGTLHCPIVLKKIDTPIIMFEAGNNTVYQKKPQ
jgi:hypothetical protein